MDSSIDQLARRIAELFKQNRNPPSASPRVGKVIKVNPLEVQWGESIILKKAKLHTPKGMTFHVGDKVTIAPDENLKMFFVLNILE